MKQIYGHKSPMERRMEKLEKHNFYKSVGMALLVISNAIMAIALIIK